MNIWRRRRKSVEEAALPAYLQGKQLLLVPRALLAATHAFFLPYWRAGVETACFWFGAEGETLQVATTLATPRLYQSRGHYRVDRDSLRRMSSAMRGQGLVNLAQVHAHPGSWVGHSPHDDAQAYSTRSGALSLIWPDYGRDGGHTLDGVGVHERRDGEWVQLDAEAVERRVQIVDSHADFRWEIEQERGDEHA